MTVEEQQVSVCSAREGDRGPQVTVGLEGPDKGLSATFPNTIAIDQ